MGEVTWPSWDEAWRMSCAPPTPSPTNDSPRERAGETSEEA